MDGEEINANALFGCRGSTRRVGPTASAAIQVLTNGGFVTGSFTGWTIGPSSQFTTVATQNSMDYPHGGTYFASLGSNTFQTGSIFQSFDTVPGQRYDVEFFINGTGAANSTFEA